MGQEWGGGPVFPGGSRSVAQCPVPFLPLPLSSFAEPRSGVLGCSFGSPRGLGQPSSPQYWHWELPGVPQRAASLLPQPAPQPFSGDFTTSTSVFSPLRPAGAGVGGPRGFCSPVPTSAGPELQQPRWQCPDTCPGALGRVQPLVRVPSAGQVPWDPPKPAWSSIQAAQPSRTPVVEQPGTGLSSPKDGLSFPPLPLCEQ